MSVSAGPSERLEPNSNSLPLTLHKFTNLSKRCGNWKSKQRNTRCNEALRSQHPPCLPFPSHSSCSLPHSLALPLGAPLSGFSLLSFPHPHSRSLSDHSSHFACPFPPSPPCAFVVCLSRLIERAFTSAQVHARAVYCESSCTSSFPHHTDSCTHFNSTQDWFIAALACRLASSDQGNERC